ncbi:uncharacterized protein LOC125561900 [Nematostella vectensis]|uniref:uncharacterized protein LOC125561900 n=1 Tax=Nematostella vectensis TaxID=45351 RepID=UPI002076F9A1|nr:uncharacterized protein LOC125561900 [Nematostella vectensis]
MAQRNYNSAWCCGTSNTKKDTNKRKSLRRHPSYAATTIGRAIYKLNNTERERLSKLLEIAYVIAKEELPFTKFVAIAQLEKKHGVDLGVTYLNDHACAEFIDSIAEVYEDELNQVCYPLYMYEMILLMPSLSSLVCLLIISLNNNVFLLQKKVHYISILVDGSTDSSNAEKELIYILYLDPETGKPKLRFFLLRQPCCCN